MRQTILYRAASTSDPVLGLADGRTRPEPLHSPSLQAEPTAQRGSGAHPSLFGRGSDDVVLKEVSSEDSRVRPEVSSEDSRVRGVLRKQSRSRTPWLVLDAIGGPPSARFDVTLIGTGGELGVLGVSRVFNIIRSIDFVRKGPARAAGSDRLVSAAAAAATGIGSYE